MLSCHSQRFIQVSGLPPSRTWAFYNTELPKLPRQRKKDARFLETVFCPIVTGTISDYSM